MRFTATFAATAALATTAFAAPAPDAAPFGPPGRFGRPTTTSKSPSASSSSGLTSSSAPSCSTGTSVVTSVETSTTTSVVTATVVVTETYTATPSATLVPDLPQSQCITDDDAGVIAHIFQLLIQEYSDELALTALTEDFVDWSSAVNILINGGAELPKNITGPTFSGRQAFMDGQGSQPQIPFTTLNVFHGCDSVSVRWMTTRSANGQASEVAAIPVIGNVILYVLPAEEGSQYNFRIKDIYSEFNAAAWLVNLGVFTPEGPVNYFNATNATSAKRSLSRGVVNLRGPMI